MSWRTADLTSLCRPRQWPTISKSELIASGFPVYGANGRIGFYSEYNHEEPTILITCRGATCGTINVCDSQSYVTGNAMALDELDHDRADLRFMVYALRGADFSSVITGVAQPQITRQTLSRLQIPLPPLAEQKRIARILDAADALRAKRREALADLDTLLQATFLDLFGDPVTNPKGWDIRSGNEVFGDLTYGTSAKCSDVQTGDMLPVLRIPNIIGGQINREDLKFVKLPEKEVDNLRLKRDDLLFVRTNGNPDYIGRCARFDGRLESIYASYLIRTRLKEQSGLDAEFLKHQIESPAYRREVRKEARTTAGNYNLSTVGIKKLRFIVPPMELQKRYTAAVEAAEGQKSRFLGHVAELDTLFASLQSRAFRGAL